MEGGWAFQFKNNGQDLLDLINETATESHVKWFKILSKITVYLYPNVTQLSSIPIFSIIIRYNLLENKICSRGINKKKGGKIIFSVGEFLGGNFPMGCGDSFLYWKWPCVSH